MKFEDWVEKNRRNYSRTQFLKNFSEKTGVSLQTLQHAARGGRMGRYQKAAAISKGTDGCVAIEELCES